MAATTALSVPQWMKVRNAVAEVLRRNTSSTKSLDMAESLMMKGWVDVDAVLTDLEPKPVEPDPTED